MCSWELARELCCTLREGGVNFHCVGINIGICFTVPAACVIRIYRRGTRGCKNHKPPYLIRACLPDSSSPLRHDQERPRKVLKSTDAAEAGKTKRRSLLCMLAVLESRKPCAVRFQQSESPSRSQTHNIYIYIYIYVYLFIYLYFYLFLFFIYLFIFLFIFFFVGGIVALFTYTEHTYVHTGNATNPEIPRAIHPRPQASPRPPNKISALSKVQA